MRAADINPRYDVGVLNSIPIDSVVSRFAELKRKGARLVTKCIWHDDHDPSLVLYQNNQENHAYCFTCAKRYTPIDYVMQSTGLDFLGACAWMAREFNCGIIEGYVPRVYVPKILTANQSRPKDVIRYTYIPMEIVDGMVSCESSFVKCLMREFDPNRVEFLVDEYKLGCYEYSHEYYDDVVFPSIDEKGRVHNLKLQNYCTDVESEHFFHSRDKHFCWLGKILVEKGILPKDSVFDNDCMFGAHLLNKYPSDPVILVESPKNAIVGAAMFSDAVWIAAGNKGMLKYEVLKCLKGRDVMVYPDRDAIGEWTHVLSSAKMRALANFKVGSFCELFAPQGAAKYDIADYILSH